MMSQNPVLPRSTLSRLILLGLFLALIVQTTASARTNAITVDEPVYIGAGYHIMETGEYYLSTHPTLLQRLMAVPLLFMDLEMPEPDDYTLPLERIDYAANYFITKQFIEHNGDQLEQITFYARLPMIVLSLVLGLYVYLWSSELFGVPAGLFALALYTLNPNILAHSSLATLDIGYAAFIFISLYHFRRVLLRPNLANLLITGVVQGLTVATRANAFIIIPLDALYLFVVIIARPPMWPFLQKRLPQTWWSSGLSFGVSLAGLGIIMLIVLNLTYGFDGTLQPVSAYIELLNDNPEEFVTDQTDARDERLTAMAGPFLNLPVPLPNWYVQSTGWQFLHNNAGHVTYLLGESSDTGQGWWHFQIVAFLLKMPIPVMILMVGWVLFVATRPKGQRLSLGEIILLVPIVVLFALASITSIKNGFRLALPMLPFLFVLLSRLMTFDVSKARWVAPVLALLGVWHLISTVSVAPLYLTYFNEIAGGPDNGERYLVGSDLDWGQGMYGLQRYVEAEGITDLKFIDYVNAIDPEYFLDIDVDLMHAAAFGEMVCEPTSGILAINITAMKYSPTCYEWLDRLEPVAKIDNSILIYDVPPSQSTDMESPSEGEN